MNTNLEWLDEPDEPGEWWVGKPGKEAILFDIAGDPFMIRANLVWADLSLWLDSGYRFARYVPPVVPVREETTP